LLHAGPVTPDAATGEDSVSEEHIIARRVLHEGTGYATLLLSATPFKALTHLDEEQEGQAHEKQLNDLLRYRHAPTLPNAVRIRPNLHQWRRPKQQFFLPG